MIALQSTLFPMLNPQKPL